MEITIEQIQNFMSLYEKEYGVKITEVRAKELATKLLLFLKVIID